MRYDLVASQFAMRRSAATATDPDRKLKKIIGFGRRYLYRTAGADVHAVAQDC
jgi:hypothetical protein